MHFAYLLPDGVVHSTGSCPDGTVLPEIGDLTPITLDAPLGAGQWQMVGGTLQPYTPPPPPEPTLAEARVSKWDEIKRAREATIDAPLVTPYGTFDSGPTDRTNITDAVLLAQTLNALGTPTTISFTRFDNTVASLDTAAMVTVGLLLGQKVQQAYATARSLRTQIESATTVAQVEAIAWPA